MRVLATSYGGSHIKTLEPILNELIIRGHECVYMPQTAAIISIQTKIKTISFMDYVDKKDNLIIEYGKKLAEKHHNSRVMEYDRSVLYLGTLFKELVDQSGEEIAWKKYNKYGLRVCNPIKYMLNVIGQEKPDFVIATNAPRMERALLNAAVLNKIKNICVVDFQGLRSIDWLASSKSCDAIAVNAQITIDKLIEKGRKSSDIYLTGSPLFENINKNIESAKKWRTENKLDDKKIIFFADQPDYKLIDLPLKIRIKLHEICQKNNLVLITRFHPSLKRNEKKFPNELISKNSQPVEEIVNACDLCITMTSTVGWMAILANKPTVIVNMSSTSSFLKITDKEGASVVNSIEEIEGSILTLLNENLISKELTKKRMMVQKYENSTKVIVDVIDKM